MQEESKSSLRDYERDLWEMEARQKAYRRFQLIFQVYAVLGALIGVVALTYFFIRRLDIALSYMDQLILMAAGSGFAMSVLSALFLFLRKQRYELNLERGRDMSAAAEFLLQWARFEGLGRERLESAGRDFNRMSIRAIIAELLNAKLIDEDEMAQLEELLRFRNVLVHSGSPVAPEVLARMTDKLRSVMKDVEA
ncbi:MAG: hypothetical protein U1F76_25050 [Candidatus Competibacteraceae bacterium]